jgi:hypothetical protein
MKTKIVDVTRRGAASALFAVLLPAAVALPLVSSCAADEPETDTASQGLGASCTILRPVGWSVGTGRCHEFTIPVNAPPIRFTLPDGDEATFGATPGGMFGSGQITFLCTNGVLSIVSESCTPGGGEEQ